MPLDSGKPFQKITYSRAILQILEKGTYWNPGSPEYKNPTYHFGILRHFGAT